MTFKYCPYCGQKGSLKSKTKTQYVCQNCQQIYWDNPRATVAVVMLNDNLEALYSQRAIEPNKGKFDFPGGFLEYNENIYDACARELKEELNIVVKPDALQIINAYTLEYLPGVSVTDIVLIANSWEGEFKPQDDVAAVAWKSLSFTNSSQFAPSYHDLEKIIHNYLNQ